MNISKLKLVTTFLFGGGVSGVIEYVLGVLKNALASLSDTTKEKIQAVLNLSLKVLSILEAVKILVPTKWQTAYTKTIAAVESCVASLTDLELTKEELDIICDKVTAAIDAWKSPDDDTCVDCKVLTMLIAALCVSTTFAVGFMRIENGSVEIPFHAARVVGMEAVSTNKTGTGASSSTVGARSKSSRGLRRPPTTRMAIASPRRWRFGGRTLPTMLFAQTESVLL